MYYKLGFQRIGLYSDPSPVEVMMLDTEYERKKQRMEHFVKPLMARLVRLLDFDEREEAGILAAMETLVSAPAEENAASPQ